jgi:hypothetical protein
MSKWIPNVQLEGRPVQGEPTLLTTPDPSSESGAKPFVTKELLRMAAEMDFKEPTMNTWQNQQKLGRAMNVLEAHDTLQTANPDNPDLEWLGPFDDTWWDLITAQAVDTLLHLRTNMGSGPYAKAAPFVHQWFIDNVHNENPLIREAPPAALPPGESDPDVGEGETPTSTGE